MLCLVADEKDNKKMRAIFFVVVALIPADAEESKIGRTFACWCVLLLVSPAAWCCCMLLLQHVAAAAAAAVAGRR